jgi:hypothetical protein
MHAHPIPLEPEERKGDAIKLRESLERSTRIPTIGFVKTFGMNMPIPKCNNWTAEYEAQQSTIRVARELGLDEIVNDRHPLEKPKADRGKQHERQ